MRSLSALALLLVALAAASPASASTPPGAGNPAWSPDGREIAFVYFGARQRLAAMSAVDGSHKRTILSNRDACCGPVEWAAGGRIAFVENYRLETVAETGGAVTRLADGAPWFVLSPNRETIAFDAGCGCGHAPDAIGLVSVAGGGVTLVPKPKTATDSIDGFSPDGTQLVFSRYRFGSQPSDLHPSLMVASVRFGQAVPLARSGLVGARLLPPGADAPQWSPDGRWIAFVLRGKLELVPTGGGDPRVLVPGHFGAFAWSPDSRRLAYVAKLGRQIDSSELRLATVDVGGRRKVLWRGPVRYAGNSSLDRPQWSPDGTKLVFTGSVGGRRPAHVWVVGADGRGLRKLA